MSNQRFCLTQIFVLNKSRKGKHKKMSSPSSRLCVFIRVENTTRVENMGKHFKESRNQQAECSSHVSQLLVSQFINYMFPIVPECHSDCDSGSSLRLIFSALYWLWPALVQTRQMTAITAIEKHVESSKVITWFSSSVFRHISSLLLDFFSPKFVFFFPLCI